MEPTDRYVVTTTDEEERQQTFVFDGTMNLDQLFTHVAERSRGGGFAAAAARLSGKHRVFSLTVSRDESREPTASERFNEQMGLERESA